MSKGKKSAKTPGSNEGSWEEALAKEEVGEVNWRFYLILIVAGNLAAELHVEALKQSIQKGHRRRFTVFDKEKILQAVTEDAKPVTSAGKAGGGGKPKSGSAMKDTSLHSEVCEQVASVLASGETISTSLLAKLVKYCILKQKKADFNAEAMKNEILSQSADAKATKKAASGGNKGQKKGKATPAPEDDAIPVPSKPPTSMKKRGEEADCREYIDDEPEDGPHRYIVLTGFTEAELVPELISLNVAVHGIVKLMCECNSKDTDGEEKQMGLQLEHPLEFWSTLSALCSNVQTLQDVALVDLIATRNEVPNTEEEKEFYGTELFGKLAELTYKLLTLRSQYDHYMGYLNILDVPFISNLNSSTDKTMSSSEVEQSGLHTPSTSKQIPQDLRYYKELMSYIPEESVDVGLILHCLVEQVSLNLQSCKIDLAAKSEKSSNPIIQMNLSTLINRLALDSKDKKALIPESISGPTQSVEYPILLPYHNLLQQRTHHLTNPSQMDIKASALQMLESSQLSKMFTTAHQQIKEHTFDDTGINALDNFCIKDDVSQSAFHYTLALLALEHLHLPNASSCPTRSFQLKPIDFDHPFKLKENCILSTALEASVFFPLKSYGVIEYIDKESIMQILHELELSTHPFIECFHHKHLKSAILVAHTGYDQSFLHEYKWLAQSHFPLGFQNYIHYVAELFGAEVEMAVALDAEIAATAQEEQKRKEGQQAQSTDDRDTPSGTTALKSAKTPSSGKKSKQDSVIKDPPPLESSLAEKPRQKLFNAYDLDGSPFLCNGYVSTAFTADGTQIRTESVEFVSKPTSVSTTILDGKNRVTLYHVKKNKHYEKIQKSAELPGSDKKFDASQAPVLLSPIPQPSSEIICCGLQASFKNSLTVSLSHFGPDANGTFPFKPELPKILNEGRSTSSSRPNSQATPPPSQKMSKKQLEQQQQILEEQKKMDELFKKSQAEYAEKWNTLITQCKYQQLYASNSCGLHIQCQIFTDPCSSSSVLDGSDGYIVIRQSYPHKGKGTQTCEYPLLHAAYLEHHRCYLPDGSVICFQNQAIMILCADGSILRTATMLEHEQYSKLSSSQKQTKDISDRLKPVTSAVSFVSDVGHDHTHLEKSLWVVTTSYGERFYWKDCPSPCAAKCDDTKSPEVSGQVTENGEKQLLNGCVTKPTILMLNPISVCRALDPVTKEEILTREDDTVILNQPNGTCVSEFPDGTRITTVSAPGSMLTEALVECPGYASVHYYSKDKSLVTYPDGSVIECTADGSYCIQQNGHYLLQVNKDGCASYENLQQKKKNKCIFSHTETENMLQYWDSKENFFKVDFTGMISVQANIDAFVPIHQNFLPTYFWIPSEAPPYAVIPESVLEHAMSEATKNVHSTVITDSPSSDSSLTTSTAIFQPCWSGTLANYVLPYARVTLLPPNLHGMTFLIKSNNTGDQPQNKALKYQYFIIKHYVNKSTKDHVLAGISNYIAWQDKQEAISNSLLPSLVQDKQELENALLLEKKWINSVPISLFNPSELYQQYKSSQIPVKEPKNETLHTVTATQQQKKKVAVIDDLKHLKETRHPPYFSLYQIEVANTLEGKELPGIGSKKETSLPISLSKVPSSSGYMEDNMMVPILPPDKDEQHEASLSSNKAQLQLKDQKKPPKEKSLSRSMNLTKMLQIIPAEINFGILSEGGTYSQSVVLRNNGTKPARFKVKKTTGSPEIVVRYTPGPIAAGMSRPLTVEITIPINCSTLLDIEDKLEIGSEAGIVFLPVKATIIQKC